MAKVSFDRKHPSKVAGLPVERSQTNEEKDPIEKKGEKFEGLEILREWGNVRRKTNLSEEEKA